MTCLKKLLCRIGIHDWNYCAPNGNVIRYCWVCRKQQEWRWPNQLRYWETTFKGE